MAVFSKARAYFTGASILAADEYLGCLNLNIQEWLSYSDPSMDWYVQHTVASGQECSDTCYAENYKRIDAYTSFILSCPTVDTVNCVCFTQNLFDRATSGNYIDDAACFGDLRSTEHISTTNKHCNAPTYTEYGAAGSFALGGFERAALYRSTTVAPSTSPTISPTKAPTFAPTSTPTRSPTTSPTTCVEGEFNDLSKGYTWHCSATEQTFPFYSCRTLCDKTRVTYFDETYAPNGGQKVPSFDLCCRQGCPGECRPKAYPTLAPTLAPETPTPMPTLDCVDESDKDVPVATCMECAAANEVLICALTENDVSPMHVCGEGCGGFVKRFVERSCGDFRARPPVNWDFGFAEDTWRGEIFCYYEHKQEFPYVAIDDDYIQKP